MQNTYEAVKVDRQKVLREVAYKSPLAHVWLTMHARGQIDFEGALIGIISSMFKQNKELMDEIIRLKSTTPDAQWYRRER